MLVRILTLVLIVTLLPTLGWAARGFGTTSGTAATDVVTSGSIASTTLRSYWMRVTLNTVASSDRLLKHNSTALSEIVLDVATDRYRFSALWSGGLASWRTPAATGSHTLAITYDGGSSANAPIMYVDGASLTVTLGTAASGTLTSGSGAITIGNSELGDRVCDCIISELAVYDVILSGANVTSLHNGARPDGIGTAPTHYWKLCGADSPELADVGGSSGTVTGALRQPHPIRNCGSQVSATGGGN